MKRIMSVLAAVTTVCALPAAARPDSVELSAEVAAPRTQVWEALTTPQGVATFFASESRVEPEVGGAYEMYFLPSNPPGLRGGEGIRILAMEPPSRLLISWNAPSSFGALRGQYTVVEFALAEAGPDLTRVELTHSGWGEGQAWQAVRDYFSTAWQTILGRLQYRFDRGPVNWANVPDGEAYYRERLPD